MDKFFDRLKHRIVFVEDQATPDFWDQQWTAEAIDKFYPEKVSKRDLITKFTKEFLPFKSKILEGGCGLGQNVHSLFKSNYEVIGVDFAPKTVALIKKHSPELDIVLGDVMDLPFPDDLFDGYWSIGVIEHFYNGYTQILSEMARAVKTGGMLFISFPHMSLLRRIKAKLHGYPDWNANKELLKKFYQFALSDDVVIKDLNRLGFELVKKHHYGGVKGLKSEISVIRPLLHRIHCSENIVLRVIDKLISALCSKFTSHNILLILKKK